MAIILDASASIDENTFNLAKDFTKTLLRRFTISPDNSRVSIVSYSQYINVQSRFSDDQDEKKLDEILSNTFYEASSTGTGKTMQAVNFEVFSTESGSRIGNPGKQFIEQNQKKTSKRLEKLVRACQVILTSDWMKILKWRVFFMLGQSSGVIMQQQMLFDIQIQLA